MSVRDLEIPNFYNLQCNGLQSTNGLNELNTATQFNTSSNITAAAVVSGILVCNGTGAVTWTIPSGFAASLVAAMPFKTLGSTLVCLAVNNTASNALTISSSDTNTTIGNTIGTSTNVPANSSRVLYFIINNASTPAVTLY